jgi:methylglutaconyl-CoA hydratase
MVFYTSVDTETFGSARFQYIKTEQRDHVFCITLCRSEKRNALNFSMTEEIIYALAFAHYSESVRCIVVDAEGTVFCAGADLQAFQEKGVDQANKTFPRSRQELRLGDAFSQLFKPSICLVEGAVLAGGFLIICGCTFVVSTREAFFGLPEVKRGLWPMQVTASLRKVMSQRKILEMAISASNYTAEEALSFGLVTSIVDKKLIRSEVNLLADKVCQNAPYAIQMGMRALNQLGVIPENEQHAYLKKQLDELLLSQDAQEGALAFSEKRKPIWKGY